MVGKPVWTGEDVEVDQPSIVSKVLIGRYDSKELTFNGSRQVGNNLMT